MQAGRHAPGTAATAGASSAPRAGNPPTPPRAGGPDHAARADCGDGGQEGDGRTPMPPASAHQTGTATHVGSHQQRPPSSCIGFATIGVRAGGHQPRRAGPTGRACRRPAPRNSRIAEQSRAARPAGRRVGPPDRAASTGQLKEGPVHAAVALRRSAIAGAEPEHQHRRRRRAARAARAGRIGGRRRTTGRAGSHGAATSTQPDRLAQQPLPDLGPPTGPTGASPACRARRRAISRDRHRYPDQDQQRAPHNGPAEPPVERHAQGRCRQPPGRTTNQPVSRHLVQRGHADARRQ